MLEINLLSPKKTAYYWGMRSFSFIAKNKILWVSVTVRSIPSGVDSYYHISKVRDYIQDITN
jgi:hypothetical protein